MPALFPATFPVFLGGTNVEVPEEAIDHEASAIKRLAQYIKDKPNFLAFLQAFTAQAQAVEDALQQLFTERGVDTATGEELDNLGNIVGEARGGLDDTTYRNLVKSGILLNKSSGTVSEILEVFALILPPGVIPVIVDEAPGQFRMVLTTADFVAPPFGPTIPTYAQLLQRAKAAGVRALLDYALSENENVFTFDGTADQALDVGAFRGTLE